MKTWIKVSLWLLIIGLVLVIMGAILGGSFMFWNWGENRKLDSFSQQFLEEETESIKELRIKIGASHVEIKNGDRFQIQATNINKDCFNVDKENGILEIREERANFLRNKNSNATIILTIPENYFFQKASIEIGAGKVDGAELLCENCNIKVGAGQVMLKQLKAKELSVNCGVGETVLKGVVDEKANIRCGMGNVTLQLTGEEKEYNYHVKVGIGDITINETSYSGINNSKQIQNTEKTKQINLDCGVGKISLTINKEG